MYDAPYQDDEDFDRSKHIRVNIDRVELDESQYNQLRQFANLFVSATFVVEDEDREEEDEYMKIYEMSRSFHFLLHFSYSISPSPLPHINLPSPLSPRLSSSS
eukprot:749747-Hanusia_phi.AAC.1